MEGVWEECCIRKVNGWLEENEIFYTKIQLECILREMDTDGTNELCDLQVFVTMHRNGVSTTLNLVRLTESLLRYYVLYNACSEVLDIS